MQISDSKRDSRNTTPGTTTGATNGHTLDPVWSIYSLCGALFFVALYAIIFFHPTRSVILLFLTIGPVGFRGLFLIASRIAKLRQASQSATRLR